MKRISEYAAETEAALLALNLSGRTPSSLYAPIAYALEAGGKRLRPVLVLMTVDAFGGQVDEAMRPALGMELFHNFTLLHDDVMDNSDTRRNRPTVYSKYGANAAILSGDTMLGLAQELICLVPDAALRRVMDVFNRMSIEVYEGQALDMEFETRNDVTPDEYVEMIRLKTGALLGACAEIGGILAGCDEKVCAKLHAYGENLGIAFQIEDDWLDTFGDAATFGKPIGGDINQAKKTFLYVSGMAAGTEEAKALQIAMEMPAGDMRVKTVTRIYEKMHLDESCRKASASYSAKALKAVKSTGLPEDRLESFKYLLDRLSGRKK
ncbi:MAG: polyprenyl synthetase family protein [Muribaculaceae bacterium]|nr:polyprenyl synthetase family protein [Muribaculaceae bacterium]